MRKVLPVFLFIFFTFFTFIAQGAEGENMTVEDGRKVGFEYALFVDEEMIDSSEAKGPFEYVHGKDKILQGLSSGLEGMKLGEEKKITLPPDAAYGEVDANAFREIPKTQLPPDVDPAAGMMLETVSSTGRPMLVRIAEVRGDSVVIDFNHPLAGKTLVFDIKVISIEETTAP